MTKGTKVVCAVRGCNHAWNMGDSSGYTRGNVSLCNRHWTEWLPLTFKCARCDRQAMTQECAPCRRRLCADCYGEWNALACRECKEKARQHVQTAE